MNSKQQDISVAIVGGGLCGLACAVGLCKAGITVNVYEAHSTFEEVGAGVGIGPNAVKALRALGCLDTILAHPGVQQPTNAWRFWYRSGPGTNELFYDYPLTREDDEAFAIYRPTFLEAVVELLDPSILHFNKRCVTVSPNMDGKASIEFADGSIVAADIVVGADGIRSVTRSFVQDDADTQHMKFTNTLAYRALIKYQHLKAAGLQLVLDERPTCFVGNGRHIIAFPVKGGEVINVVAFVAKHDIPMSPALPLPWIKSVPEGEILEEFTGWGDDATILLEHMKKSSKWFVHALSPPLPTFTKGRLVLIGDAAHAMLPHLGAGAGQGFEDAVVLVRLLREAVSGGFSLDSAIEAYSKLRTTRANMILTRSQDTGRLYDSFERGGEELLTPQLLDIMAPVWHHDLDREVEEIIDSLSM
ncbi:FAD/NAD-P-binding domain-containing protein [Mucidula mucida]|nr:FAD/NAD-P-binding domain-containing protein [Mucidula mucida]